MAKPITRVCDNPPWKMVSNHCEYYRGPFGANAGPDSVHLCMAKWEGDKPPCHTDEPITREHMEHLVQCQITIHEEALDETIADSLRAIVERTLNGWKALRTLLLEPDRRGEYTKAELLDLVFWLRANLKEKARSTKEHFAIAGMIPIEVAPYDRQNARRITAKVRQELGVTDEEFDALLTVQDALFIKHIAGHLKPGEEVVCKICGKSAKQIIEEGKDEKSI